MSGTKYSLDENRQKAMVNEIMQESKLLDESDWPRQDRVVQRSYGFDNAETLRIYNPAAPKQEWDPISIPKREGKLPERVFLFWGYMMVDRKQCYDPQSMYTLGNYEQILVAKDTRLLVMYT